MESKGLKQFQIQSDSFKKSWNQAGNRVGLGGILGGANWLGEEVSRGFVIAELAINFAIQ